MHSLKNVGITLRNKFLPCQKMRYIKYKRPWICDVSHRSKCTSDITENVESEEWEAYKQISSQYLGTVLGGHNVLVLQPYVKWGRDKKKNTTPALQLDEAVALIETLPTWKVVDTCFAPLMSLQRKTLLGSGSLENLKKKVRNNSEITAVFVSTNLLKHMQVIELQKALSLPIYDRYSIVIHIFRLHAKSPEAKLQVALAELPYIKKKMKEIYSCGGEAVNVFKEKKEILHAREAKLKSALNKLKEHRTEVRRRRKDFNFPSVAVVGYTNAGKTSLIKALTGDTNLKPRNQLFATLDTTAHEGVLPCRLKVLYMDTIGFIQDVPETLLEPFKVTLEDALVSDIIIHIYDVSHPDMQAQFQHVQEIIKPMLDENQCIINVANKFDLVKENESVPEDVIAVSATKLIGIDALQSEIEKQILKVTGRSVRRIRVLSGSLEASWLYKETTVINAEPDPKDYQYIFLDVITTDFVIEKFKRFLRR